MGTNQNGRNYNCKDEELPVIAGYAHSNVLRDKEEFQAFSPEYSDESLAKLEDDINHVNELVNPKSEITALKLITGRLYKNMDDVGTMAYHLEGYVMLAKKELSLTAKDFGLTSLKHLTKVKNAEGTLDQLKLVITNVQKYKEPLAAKGLTDDLIDRLSAAIGPISEDNQTQYKMVNDRKEIVQANLGSMNALYEQVIEICRIGKILFQGNTMKVKEYTFTELKKKVRAAVRHSDDNDNNK